MGDESVAAPSVFQATRARGRQSSMGKEIELAMAQAILDANAEGISTAEENSPELHRRQMAARQRVKDEWAARE